MMNASRPILLIRLSSEIPTLLTKYSLQQLLILQTCQQNKRITLDLPLYQEVIYLSIEYRHFQQMELQKTLDVIYRLQIQRLCGSFGLGLMLKWNPCIIDVCCEWLNQWLWHYMFWQKLFWKHDTKDDWSSVLTFYWMSVFNSKLNVKCQLGKDVSQHVQERFHH